MTVLCLLDLIHRLETESSCGLFAFAVLVFGDIFRRYMYLLFRSVLQNCFLYFMIIICHMWLTGTLLHLKVSNAVQKKVQNDSFSIKAIQIMWWKFLYFSCHIFHMSQKEKKNIAMSVISSIMQLYCGTSLSPKTLTLVEYWMEVRAMCLLNILRCK